MHLVATLYRHERTHSSLQFARRIQPVDDRALRSRTCFLWVPCVSYHGRAGDRGRRHHGRRRRLCRAQALAASAVQRGLWFSRCCCRQHAAQEAAHSCRLHARRGRRGHALPRNRRDDDARAGADENLAVVRALVAAARDRCGDCGALDCVQRVVDASAACGLACDCGGCRCDAHDELSGSHVSHERSGLCGCGCTRRAARRVARAPSGASCEHCVVDASFCAPGAAPRAGQPRAALSPVARGDPLRAALATRHGAGTSGLGTELERFRSRWQRTQSPNCVAQGAIPIGPRWNDGGRDAACRS
eukprot:Amastigsp_a340052_137.p2 type:complete len:303 gc:universal Amastigsp_a340052_137:1429-521(-)